MSQSSPRTLLARIAAAIDRLRPAERRVGELVLADPAAATAMSIAALAAAADVSQPTVLRFCRSVGCQRFPEFKLRLGQALVTGVPFVHAAVTRRDRTDEIVAKVFDSSIAGLIAARESLDIARIETLARRLRGAARIDCFGAGSASLLAFEAQQKLMQIGLPAIAYPDTHLQTMAAASLRRGDVALCFSHTGAVHDIVRIAEVAAEGGAFVAAVTRAEAPLARVAALTLAVEAPEDTEVFAPRVSRLAHLALIDVLVTVTALAMPEAGMKRIRRIKNSVVPFRIPR